MNSLPVTSPGQESVRPGEHLPYAVILGDDRDHDLALGRNGARIRGDGHATCRRGLAALGIVVPGDDAACLLAQPLCDGASHPAEPDQSDLHAALPCRIPTPPAATSIEAQSITGMEAMRPPQHHGWQLTARPAARIVARRIGGTLSAARQ
jgi:hypothetical protein